MVNISKFEILLFCYLKHLVSIVFCEEFSFLVQQFQRIPMTWIVARCNDDTTCSLTHTHSQFGSRCRGKSDVKHVIAHAHQCSTNNVLHHFARDTGITSHYNCITFRLLTMTDKSRISCCKLHNVERVQCVSGLSANSSTDAGNRFNQSHKYLYYLPLW